MNDSRIDDRRDVAHPTNPLGGHENIEQDDLGRPMDADAEKLSAAGEQSHVTGLPREGDADDMTTDAYGGTPHNIPPARTGKASEPKAEAEVRGRTSNSGGTNRVDPATRIPEPVTQDLGFRRNANDGER
jgi:hypothetical protein